MNAAATAATNKRKLGCVIVDPFVWEGEIAIAV
jgi:hypothetical protein